MAGWFSEVVPGGSTFRHGEPKEPATKKVTETWNACQNTDKGIAGPITLSRPGIIREKMLEVPQIAGVKFFAVAPSGKLEALDPNLLPPNATANLDSVPTDPRRLGSRAALCRETP